MNRKQEFQLLPKASIVKTSEFDHAGWNFRSFLGPIQRTRFRLAASLIGESRAGRILELGYGSGILMPHLANCCDELHGIDLHGFTEEVSTALSNNGVEARLECGDVSMLPYPSGFFDIVVAVSSLEYVREIDAACLEISRVLCPRGFLVVVTPRSSSFLDAALKLFGGEDAKSNYGNRREKLPHVLGEYLRVERVMRWPAGLPPTFTVYLAMRLVPKLREGVVLNS